MFRFANRLTKQQRIIGGIAATGTGLIVSANSLLANDDALPAPEFPWSHRLPWQAFDHKSARRGYQVFKEVCSSCHSLNLITYRQLVGTILTEDEARADAADTMVLDGPNDEGEMFEREGKLSDPLPSPYPNENAARAANNGAYPPDLTLMAKARPNGQNYIFSLITGYREPPAGVSVREGMYYNPYFPGGAIGMAQALMDGSVEYEDGTEASISQMAKDVTTFLSWAAEPEHDERKELGIQAMVILSAMALSTFYLKRFKWSVPKSRVIRYLKKP